MTDECSDAGEHAAEDLLYSLRSSRGRGAQMWEPTDELRLLSLFPYFSNNWRLYSPYFDRPVSSIKMKYHNLYRALERRTRKNQPNKAVVKGDTKLGPERLSKLDAILLAKAVAEASKGNADAAIELLRVCGSCHEVEHIVRQNPHIDLSSTEGRRFLKQMAPMESGGAPLSFGYYISGVSLLSTDGTLLTEPSSYPTGIVGDSTVPALIPVVTDASAWAWFFHEEVDGFVQDVFDVAHVMDVHSPCDSSYRPLG
ncbi:hypothetical protein GMRT_11001 [Giardia muris]|uniref:Myb-like domain-containing protein n=1 Tax=Giardia muris TaxID=5742 RepID=A0A4Z1STR4_GIAMU|nr:hypothetical protein GMRT_11001 [Giardia muris]|eukprot:TNJ29312.1 hypothetical protein GMRT_11001 [Giardia muris]